METIARSKRDLAPLSLRAYLGKPAVCSVMDEQKKEYEQLKQRLREASFGGEEEAGSSVGLLGAGNIRQGNRVPFAEAVCKAWEYHPGVPGVQQEQLCAAGFIGTLTLLQWHNAG